MNATSLTPKTAGQLEKVGRDRASKIRDIYKLKPEFSCQGPVGEFIDCYLLCEVMAKKLQKYYRRDLDKAEINDVQIQVLEAALKHFGVCFSFTEMKDIFSGGKGERGSKSARQLRNGYLHTLSEEDRKEILNRAPGLN